MIRHTDHFGLFLHPYFLKTRHPKRGLLGGPARLTCHDKHHSRDHTTLPSCSWFTVFILTKRNEQNVIKFLIEDCAEVEFHSRLSTRLTIIAWLLRNNNNKYNKIIMMIIMQEHVITFIILNNNNKKRFLIHPIIWHLAKYVWSTTENVSVRKTL